jgi:hypothetical protein
MSKNILLIACGFCISRSLCPFLREALADKSQKKRSYLLDPLEISTTFIHFAIAIIIIIIIVPHGFLRENPKCRSQLFVV